MTGIRSVLTLTPNGHSRLEVTYPSGAKEITAKGPGYRWSHLQLPYHEGSIYDLIASRTHVIGPTDRLGNMILTPIKEKP